MTTPTATVVTLEAAVRVLMVGNRQITQSVAKQLDHVDPWHVEPMGRVRLADETLVIGRHTDTGDLVLTHSHACRLHPQPRTLFSAHPPAHLRCDCCHGCAFIVRDWSMAYERTTFNTWLKAVDYDHTGTGNRFTDDWINQQPLIVLAGLR